MSFKRYTLPIAAGTLLAAAGLTFPASVGAAAELADAPMLSYDLDTTQPREADQPAPVQVAVADVDADELECMAKVVHHESRGQPRQGQIAVAQTLINRLKAGRFGDTICGVANQPRQFFNTASYNPRRDNDDWNTAVEVSRAVLTGQADAAVPGAMFFRASYAPPSGFFRSRQRVAAIGGHIFYR